VTHDQSEALSMGAQVAVLRDGALAQVASPEELYRRPLDAALARFVGEAVLLPGVASGAIVTCALGRLQRASPGADGPVEVMVRPEQIRSASAPSAGAVKAKVLGVTFFGHDAAVQAALAADSTPVIARVAGHTTPQANAEAWLVVEGAVMAYPRTAALAEGEPSIVRAKPDFLTSLDGALAPTA
jgi:iron(III) transport system ATP-binding protein